MTKTAVVTGAGRGLGAEIATRLVAEGYEVVRADVRGGDVHLDVTDAAACHALAREADPAVWINNAAVLHAGDAATQPDYQIDEVVRTNLVGSIHGTRAAVAVMRQRDGGAGIGHIITIGSLASWVPVPGETVYAATKAAVLSYQLGIRAELRAQGVSGIHFSVVCPDGMLTPMLIEDIDNPSLAMSFTGLRLVEPAEVADRVATLLRQPRLVSSVPHWRGAQVRAFSAIPDVVLPLAGLFRRTGEVNLAKARRRLRE